MTSELSSSTITSANCCSAACETVFASSGDLRFRVWVVDNASPDDSVGMVRRRFPQVSVIANAENVGYPAANNQGLRAMGIGDAGQLGREAPRYALLLNPDTEIDPDTLAALLAVYGCQQRCAAWWAPGCCCPTGNWTMPVGAASDTAGLLLLHDWPQPDLSALASFCAV